jgi:hypothetical protein
VAQDASMYPWGFRGIVSKEEKIDVGGKSGEAV